MRAAQNARRHGLSVSVLADPEHSADVEALAQTIAGDGAIAKAQKLARRIAEAQIDVVRVRQARRDLFTRNLNDPNLRPAISDRELLRIIKRFFRQFDAGNLIAADRIAHPFKEKFEGPEKFAVILSNLAKQLAAMERYER